MIDFQSACFWLHLDKNFKNQNTLKEKLCSGMFFHIEFGWVVVVYF